MSNALPAGESAEHPVPADRISELYNGSVASAEACEVARERVHWMCSRVQGQRVIDIGCSQGITAILLAREGFAVTGLDSHPDAIAFATEAAARETRAVAARLTWVNQDLYEFTEETPFDTVILGEVIEHQAVPERFLLTARRLLQPGGTIVLTTPFGLHPHEDHKVTLLPADVVRMAEANDLDVTEIEVVDGYIRMTARDRAGAPATARSADELLKATAVGALAAQDKHYVLMAKRAALVEARGKDIAKHTATIADLKAAAETRAKALRELESELAATRVLLEQSRAADAKAQAELKAASEAASKASDEAADALLLAQQAAHETRLALEASRDEAARLRAEIAAAQIALDRTSADHASTLTELADAQAAHDALQEQFEEMRQLALGLRESIAQQDIEHLRAAEQFELSLKESAAQLAETRDTLTRDIAERHAEIARRDADMAKREAEIARHLAQQHAESVRAAAEQVALVRKQAEADLAETRDALTRDIAGRDAEIAQRMADLARRDADLARRDAELAESRTNAAREKRSAVMSERAQQRALATYERQANTLKQSIAYQLGMILLQGFKSLQAFFAMPSKLLALRREHAQRRRMRGDRPVRELGGKDYPHLLARLKSDGFAAACGMIDALDLPGPARANAYTALARHLQGKDPAASARAATIGHEADPQPWRAKWLAYRMYDAGHLLEPARLLRELPDTVVFSASEESRTAQIAALADLFEIKPMLPYVGAAQYAAKPRSLLYVAASAMPYHLSGYTVRTAALLTALKTAGIDLTVATRPGYPWDRSDTAQSAKASQTDIGGLTYHHFRQPAQDMPLDVYIERSAAAIARLARQKQVGVIHAASNHVNALPALIAARQLGIPFHFEMRGLWEMSRASNVEGFEASERYQLGLDLEKFVARHADRVYAISQPLAAFLRDDWGVEPETIAVLANGIDSAVFGALTAEPPGQFTIGYAGALVAYEGLDLLLDAVAQLRAGGTAVSVVLIGDGAAREALEARARTLQLDDAVEFTGKIAPELARARIAACSLVCLPRRPDQVCELVPPIKLVETMALGVPLVVPDLGAFRAEAEDGVTALFFRPGDSADLARAIAAVQADPAAAGARAKSARERALAERDWQLAATLIEADLDPAKVKRQPLPAVEAPRSKRTARKLGESGKESLAALLADQDRLTAVFEEHGIAPFVAEVDRQTALVGKARAHELMRIGRALTDAGLGKAEAGLVDEALQAERSPGVLIWAYNTYQRLGDFEQTGPILSELERHPVVIANPAEQARVEKLKGGLAYQLEMLRLIEPRRPRAVEPVGNRICYMLHNSLPYSSGGYATRSHGVATGLRDAGFDVKVMTRPGFPKDIVAGLEDQMVPEIDEIDGISYWRTFEPQRRAMKFMHYVPEAARVLEEQYRKLRPSLVMSASNHVVALPALIACRRLGIPFVYEVRGFWEVTKMSREEDYGDSAAYKLQSLLEAAVCKEADHVFTLTEPMREELIDRDVAADKIDLLPNSCDPTRFIPRLRDAALAAELGVPDGVPVIGYVGTFVDYEGLEDLAQACGLLKQRGHAFRLLLVGNENTSGSETGPITQMIAEAAAESGFSDWLIMPGRVPHEVVHGYYSLLDICPFPRKPWPVCEMVSPMKPLEALAMEKLVIVSSVRALVEMIDHDHTGLVFTKGDNTSLADTLERAMASPDLRARLGTAGRRWVEAERTWRAVGVKAAGLLAPFVAPALPAAEFAK